MSLSDLCPTTGCSYLLPYYYTLSIYTCVYVYMVGGSWRSWGEAGGKGRVKAVYGEPRPCLPASPIPMLSLLSLPLCAILW